MPGRPADQKVKILYIEDNRENRMLVRAVLEAAGYVIVDAEDGLSGIEAAIREEPALILLDINLPGVDGYEIVAILKSFPNLASTPVVALTAYAMPGDRARCLEAGMDGYLTKPIQPKALLEAIKPLRVGSKPKGGSQPTDKIVLDRRALMDRVEGDAQLIAEVSGTFSETCSEHVARAREALQAGDAEKFSCEVHTLRGMFRSLSGIAAEEQAQKLEHLDVSKDREKAQSIFAALEREIQALASELSALARDALADREKERIAGKKNPGERRGRLNAQREGGAREFRAD